MMDKEACIRARKLVWLFSIALGCGSPTEQGGPETAGAAAPTGPISDTGAKVGNTTASAGRAAAGAAQTASGGAGASGAAAGSGGRDVAGATAAAGAGGVAGTVAVAGASGSAAGSGAPAAGSSGSISAAGSGGTMPAAGSGATMAAGSGKVFSECRYHFGTIGDIAKKTPGLIEQIDFFTPGWMGQKDTFDMGYVCDDTKAGGMLENKIPAIVSYTAAFYAKRNAGLQDCNASMGGNDLCTAGAKIIMQDLQKIIAIYESYAQGFASCYGTTKPIIFMMEPDFYQYTIDNQSQKWTGQQAGMVMSQFVNAIKKHLPNAVFSMDISPWVAPNDGEDNGKTWYSNFDMSLFTFINTSGGSTSASTDKIRGDKMTWKGVSEVTGKPILADTGYGVNGSSAGHDTAWDDPNNIKARMADGVVSISQYNPKMDWGSTISMLRSQLGQPKVCP